MEDEKYKCRVNPIIIMEDEFDEKQNELIKGGRKVPIELLDENSKREKNPEEKQYLLLYYGTFDNEEVKSFEIREGRTATYVMIKDMIDYIDIYDSKVIVESVPFNEGVSVYQFMKYMENFFSDGFDIEDYNNGDSNEEIDRVNYIIEKEETESMEEANVGRRSMVQFAMDNFLNDKI